MITKLEGDIRQHIAMENQMRIHIESLNNKIEEDDRVMEKMTKEFDYQIDEIKREKRRLDDLLTIREKDLEKCKDSSNEIEKKEQIIGELEKKIKHMEKKHDKALFKLQNEL